MGLKPYKALVAIDLKLALRNRSVIFFNYLFPLAFFFSSLGRPCMASAARL